MILNGKKSLLTCNKLLKVRRFLTDNRNMLIVIGLRRIFKL